MLSQLERAGSRLNHAVFKMGDYTLRRTDVNDAAERAKSLGRMPIADARLGDPTSFGMAPYQRFIELVEEALKEPRSWSYNDARGIGELRDLLGRGNVETGRYGYNIDPERIFLGPGVSGISRSLFTALINRSAGDEVVIPEWSYIIYFAEAALSEAKVANVLLNRNGEVDIERLNACINERTKAVFITTVGNPLGIAMKRETFADVIAAINAKEREYNRPIYLIADTIYEGFRTLPGPIDPIAMSIECGRIGPTIELYSISKMIGAPGARLGWMRLFHSGDDFREEVDAFVELMSRLMQPSLGSNSTAFQLALYRLYCELLEGEGRLRFDMFRRQRKNEVISRVRTLFDMLSGIDGIVFPEYYYKDGRPNAEVLNAFYIVFGVDKALLPRSGLSQARQLADFLIEHPGLPVILATPADNFLANGLRGREQEYMRIVALSERTDGIVEGIRRFVESRGAAQGGPPA